MRAFCLGPSAAARARALGWRNVVQLPEGAGAEEVVAAIADRGQGAAAGQARNP
jgi:hypothetical protein